MPRIHKSEQSSGYSILLVDDNADYLQATSVLLSHEGHQIIQAANGPAALGILREQPVDLLLLDYFMPEMTGEQVVTELRKFNPFVQVILQTGYASERPPRDMLRRLDIQGYYDKSEGPDKLLLWTEVGLKASYTIQLLNKSRQGLRYILEITPDLHKVQPLDDLLQGILLQVAGLLGAANSFLAVLPAGGIAHAHTGLPEGFVAMMDGDTVLNIRASTGRFANRTSGEDCLKVDKYQWVIETVRKGEVNISNSSMAVPLRIGNQTIGVIYLDRPATSDQDKELVNIFANQAAVAIQNTQLYEMATLDPLTGVYVRRFFDQWLTRELRNAFRSRQPLSFLMLDMDKMKQINDTAGHLVGDQALAMLGKVLRQSTRSGDIVARYGGEEFAIILPQTKADVAEQVARRIHQLLSDKTLPGPNGAIALKVSIGICGIEPHAFGSSEIPRPLAMDYFQETGRLLIQQSDAALYQSKREGGNRLTHAAFVEWQPLPQPENTRLSAPAEGGTV